MTSHPCKPTKSNQLILHLLEPVKSLHFLFIRQFRKKSCHRYNFPCLELKTLHKYTKSESVRHLSRNKVNDGKALNQKLFT